MHLWDSETGSLTDFNTQFSFNIRAPNLSTAGDGLAFFLSPFDATIPDDSSGGCLGLFDNSLAFNHTNNQIVAVEFDTFQNPWDPSSNHVGIDVNSIVSEANVTWNTRMKNGTTANAWVNYNSATTTLSVYLTYADNPIFEWNYSLSYVVDLREVLPECVSVGFSAATGLNIETHSVFSWTFNSTLEVSINSTWHKKNLRVVVGLALGIIGTLSCGVGLLLFMKWKKFNSNDFEKVPVPRKFKFREISRATNNFFEGGKIGNGGFGGVYRGVLSDTKEEIAVKCFSKELKQGKKEYRSELNTITQLSHRNLVRLIGWCNEQGEFLLIYKFMIKWSLDNHLFGGKSKQTWKVSYQIALDLASAIRYLHEECDQSVVHRDIKLSNILLDWSYNAKLGDFGLARLVDHELSLETTNIAGTLGYVVLEYANTLGYLCHGFFS